MARASVYKSIDKNHIRLIDTNASRMEETFLNRNREIDKQESLCQNSKWLTQA
jgi:hypothetical protein